MQLFALLSCGVRHGGFGRATGRRRIRRRPQPVQGWKLEASVFSEECTCVVLFRGNLDVLASIQLLVDDDFKENDHVVIYVYSHCLG